MAARLPVDMHLAALRAALDHDPRLVLVAPPGSGKSTRVPPALLGQQKLLLLQPRRVAARALARRIAAEQHWKIGEQIGWQIRFEPNFSAQTRLLVATEGILTARLRDDPLIEEFDTIILDEFHERSIHTDLALSLVRQASEVRDDLRLVVMSATLDPGPIAEYLGGAKVIEVPGRTHPLEIHYEPDIEIVNAVLTRLESQRGDVLVFLPGVADIERLRRSLVSRVPSHVSIFPLHGSQDATAQDAALRPGAGRRVILATNIAETSLTVEGVTDVIDTGLHKVSRLSTTLGIDRLELERIPQDSADQRSGRAGRTGPGVSLRLWDGRDVLKPSREAEIHRMDLTRPFLDILAWGEDPRSFAWFEKPSAERIELGWQLLVSLGAVASGAITQLGRAMVQLPLPPRLGRVLLAAPRNRRLLEACVAMADGQLFRRSQRAGPANATDNDLLTQLDQLDRRQRGFTQGLRQVEQRLQRLEIDPKWCVTANDPDEQLRHAFLLGFPDRVAKRRARADTELLMCDGFGATLDTSSGVRRGDWLLALDLQASAHGSGRQARVRSAARIEQEWLEPTDREVTVRIDTDTGRVEAAEISRYRSLSLSSRNVAVDRDQAAVMLRDALLERPLDPSIVQLTRRMQFAQIPLQLAERLLPLCYDRKGWFKPDLLSTLSWEERQQLDNDAPARLAIPSGRSIELDYRSEETLFAAVKLQELFGLAETPRIGRHRVPVTFELLAPNGRAVQTTTDLKSFWNSTYADVRKELRGRYPKHPWPDDPWSAEPTRWTKRRRK